MAVPTHAGSLLRGHARCVIIPGLTLQLASCWLPRSPQDSHIEPGAGVVVAG